MKAGTIVMAVIAAIAAAFTIISESKTQQLLDEVNAKLEKKN